MKKMFLTANEIREILGVSQSYAYSVIKELNKELKEKGFYVIRGKVDRKYFFEHFYVTRDLKTEEL